MSIISAKRLSFDEREVQIMRAAGDLFSRWGLRGTTTKAIAKEAGVNEALLFRHFPSKEALYGAYLDQIMDEWKQEVLPTFKKFHHKALKPALLGIAQSIVRRVEADPSLLRIMVLASLEDPRLGPMIFNRRLPLRDFMEDFIDKRQKNGEIRTGDKALLAATYLSLVFYYIHMKEIFGATFSFYTDELSTLKFFCKIFLEGALPQKDKKVK